MQSSEERFILLKSTIQMKILFNKEFKNALTKEDLVVKNKSKKVIA